VDEMERPHLTKVAAGGKQTLTLPIVIFSDETSGNPSKKWNHLESYSMFLASLSLPSVQFSSDGATENWVLLAKLKMLRDDANNVVHGKFTSPLLEEKEIKRLIPATALLQKVSVVHNCDY
jgi:hypothetical protein